MTGDKVKRENIVKKTRSSFNVLRETMKKRIKQYYAYTRLHIETNYLMKKPVLFSTKRRVNI